MSSLVDLRTTAALYLLCLVALFGVFHMFSVSDSPNRMYDEPPSWIEGYMPRERVRAPKTHPLYAPQHAAAFAVVLMALAGAYLLTLRAVRRSPPRLRTLLLLGLVCAVPLFVAPNLQSRDVYVYSMLGRMQTVHFVNPYLTEVGAFPSDPLVTNHLLVFHEETAPYGQVVMMMLAAVVTVVETVGGGIGGYVLSFKLVAVGLHLTNGWLIWRLLERSKLLEPALGTACYLLNPLCLLEFAGSAHNDGMGICFLLLALLMHVRGRQLMAFVAISLAVLSKIYILPVACLYGVGLAREQSARRGLMLAGVFVVVAILVILPYWDGPQSVTTFLRGNHMHKGVNSMGSLVQAMVLDAFVLPYPPDQQLVHPDTVRSVVTWGGMAIVALTCLIAAWWTDSVRRAVVAGGWYAFIGVSLGSGWFWPWYTVLPLALAIVSGSSALRRVAIALTLCAPSLYVVFALGGPRSKLPLGPELYYYKPLLVFAPALLLAAWTGVRAFRNR